MNKVIIVFTNHESLRGMGFEMVIPNFPKRIIINKNLSLFLCSDTDQEPAIQFLNSQSNEACIIYHTNGSVDKEFMNRLFGDKIKYTKTLSHLRDTYYDKQLRGVLENAIANEDATKPWKIKDASSINEDFLLKPFDDGGLETKLTLLNKLLYGNFDLSEKEKSLLTEKQLKEFQESYNNEIDWHSFKTLRDKLTLNL